LKEEWSTRMVFMAKLIHIASRWKMGRMKPPREEMLSGTLEHSETGLKGKVPRLLSEVTIQRQAR
jgi:hypothetical protein